MVNEQIGFSSIAQRQQAANQDFSDKVARTRETIRSNQVSEAQNQRKIDDAWYWNDQANQLRQYELAENTVMDTANAFTSIWKTAKSNGRTRSKK